MVLEHGATQYQPGGKGGGQPRHIDKRERVQQAGVLWNAGRFNDAGCHDQPFVVTARHALGLGLGARRPADREDVIGSNSGVPLNLPKLGALSRCERVFCELGNTDGLAA